MMFQILVALAVFLQGLQAFQFTGELHEGDVIYACQNSNVSLPWQILLASTDIITDIQWFRSRDAVEMIGVLTYGSFVAYGDFVDKVSHSTNASITLYNVELEDSGNYTVQATGSNSTYHHYELRQTVYIQIADNLMTQDGGVHVKQIPNPVLDRASGLWSIMLTCGDFTFHGQNPPYYVQWTIPGVGVRNSSKYENGQFYLPLNGAMPSGNYVCRVPLNESCLSVDNVTYGEDSIDVDSVDIRLTLLEKENEQLKIRLQEATPDDIRQEKENAISHP
ncbi:hypothetical protein ACOMHN_044989 [Nucella lapillus]